MDRDEFRVICGDAATECAQLTVSYILDALKKSEAERSRGNGRTLLTTSLRARSHSNLLIWSLLAILLVNACTMAAWLLSRPTAPVAPVADATLAAPQGPTAVAASTRPDAASATHTPLPYSPRPGDVEGIDNAAGPQAEAEVITPSSTNDTLPQIEFTTHVYADDAAQRAVTVSGRRYAEGDEIQPGVTLIEITETGVVLDVGGRTVVMDVVQGWR